ncbi:ankyrin repeat domain-containing protein 26 [Amia ocellicauda]|uniref:ankyrin repeat domain-containing protein 26 n=1 Tax=Amia ocellicauda TaxID=2972642 RepID=UPI003464BCB6
MRTESSEDFQTVEDLICENMELHDQIFQQENEMDEREVCRRQVENMLADTLMKLSMCEASLDASIRCRNEMEKEKTLMRKELEWTRRKLQETEAMYFQSRWIIHDLRKAIKEHDVLSSSSEIERIFQQLNEHLYEVKVHPDTARESSEMTSPSCS